MAAGVAAAFDLVAIVKSVVKFFAVDGDLVTKATGEELRREASLRSARVVPVASPVRFIAGSAGVDGPRDGVAELRGGGEDPGCP